MRHVSIPGDDFQSLYGLRVSDDVVQKHWTVFLNPKTVTLSASANARGSGLVVERSWM